MILRRLRAACAGWAEDRAEQMGAALAYYTLFSLVPLLLVAMMVLGAAYGEAESREHILAQVKHFINPQAARTVMDLLDHFGTARGQLEGSIVGLASLLFGATRMFTSLRVSLHRIWRLKPASHGVVRSVVRTHLLSVLMVVVTCIFLIVLLGLGTAWAILFQQGTALFPFLPRCEPIFHFLGSTVVVTLLLTFTFRLLSDARLRYSQLWFGALISALLFSAGKMAISYYLAYIHLASAYGAAGSVVVLLAWIFFSAQIVFFGAEVIRGGLPATASPPASVAG